jgi:hypothetical protein
MSPYLHTPINFAFGIAKRVEGMERAVADSIPLSDRYRPPNEDSLPYLWMKKGRCDRDTEFRCGKLII